LSLPSGSQAHQQIQHPYHNNNDLSELMAQITELQKIEKTHFNIEESISFSWVPIIMAF
jgi:hypothetical protein